MDLAFDTGPVLAGGPRWALLNTNMVEGVEKMGLVALEASHPATYKIIRMVTYPTMVRAGVAEKIIMIEVEA